jgi:hypothetical protein
VVVGTLAVLVAAWATLTERGQMQFGLWSFTKGRHVDQGTYYRLKFDLTYRGEPQHFDVVVGCHVVGIDYKDGSNTREVGLVPTVYGRRMSDGRGLVVRVPDACKGETTANGRVPTDFMPIMIVYDDANTLGFGTAYISDEAYDSPRSLMKFGTASVEQATRADFDEFRSKSEPNLVTRNQCHSAQPRDIVEAMGLKKVYPAFGRLCRSYSRALVPEALRDRVRKYWPSSQPTFWTIADGASITALRESLLRDDLLRDDGGALNGIGPWLGPTWPDLGAVHRDGAGVIGHQKSTIVRAPSIYPVASDISAAQWPTDPAQWPDFVSGLSKVKILDVEVANTSYRGFAFCYQTPDFSLTPDVFKSLKEKPGVISVDGTPVSDSAQNWSFDAENTTPLLERDQYLYDYQMFFLESTRGDV